MFRYLLLKLPSFTSKTDFPVSPPCNKTSILRPASPIKREYRRESKRNDEVIKPVHKRSYSFPSTRTRSSNLFDSETRYGNWDKCDISESQGITTRRNDVQDGNKNNSGLKEFNPEILEKRKYSTNEFKRFGNKLPPYEKMNKSEDFRNSLETTERYELEAARPRRNRSELMFDVFDYVAKNGSDPVRYLQPNKLRPFGSNDNIYLPLLMTTKTSDLDNIPQSISTHSLKKSLRKCKREVHDIQRRSYSTASKDINSKYDTEEVKSSTDTVGKHSELNPIYVSQKLSSEDIDYNEGVKNVAENSKSRSSDNLVIAETRTVEETLVGKTDKQSTADIFQSYRMSWNEPRIKIDPSPFLQCDDVIITPLASDSSKKPKKSPSDTPLKAPWPAYSERIKRNDQKCPSESTLVKENLHSKMSFPQKRTISTDNVTRVEGKPETKQLCKQRDNLVSNFSQKRSLSSENITRLDDKLETIQLSEQTDKLLDFTQKRSISYDHIRPEVMSPQTFLKRCRSSTIVHNTKPSSPNLVSLGNKQLNMNTKKNYARSSKSNNSRPYEPESCVNKEKPPKYFLPSKVRLSPPECLQKPLYRGCVPEDPCPPRADQCLKIIPKKLPILKSNKCPCIEPYIPTRDPKIRRLKFKFEDPPRICPCNPCPCPPRADDFIPEKAKKLSPYVPGNCACVEPPPMIDVPLLKLKKICEPEVKCYPPKPCPKEEPCIRADDTRVICPKSLPPLKASDCPCVEPYVPSVSPQLRRLKMEFKDPARICPCEPNCPCPPRADDLIKARSKKLPIIKSGNCQCVEPPPMVDVPLIRLKKVCTPEVCDPQKYCPVETCEDKPRADDTLKVKHKRLPILEVSNCKCIEPEIPDKLPRLRRLTMKFSDEPRICPCEPNCPCPPRADDSVAPRQRKLLPYVPGYCKCVEPPPLVDVPLIPLKKLCEPEIKCYPPKECPREIPCEEKPRADDNLCLRQKKLPLLTTNNCPCIENPILTDAPKLKRLTLHVPEPPRACPVPEPCIRADDSLKDKIRRLPLLQPGACPCIDPKPPEDIKPLKRLKCEDEGPALVCDDPCIPFPRADWGCWEYTQSIEPESDKCKKGKKGTVNYNTKRKFNTDTRASLYKTGSAYSTKDLPRNEDIISASPKQQLKFSLPKMSKVVNDIPKPKNDAEKNEPLPDNLFKVYVRKSKSLPTLRLLKQLNDIESKVLTNNANKKNSLETNQVRVLDIKSVLNKMASRSGLHNQSFMNSTKVRTLCTNAVRQTEHPKRPVSTANILFAAGKKDSNKCKDKEAKKEKCPKGSCPKSILKGCAQVSPKGCEKERTPVCCEKKPPPYPAFSEAMDEEVEPYSKTTQWTCNRKQYGFEPVPKKYSEPLDSVKNKKKFSTFTSVADPQQSDIKYVGALQDGVKLRPETYRGVREYSTNVEQQAWLRQSSKYRGGAKLNTAYNPLNPQRCPLVRQKATRDISNFSCGNMLEADTVYKRPTTPTEIRLYRSTVEVREDKNKSTVANDYSPQNRKNLLGHKGSQNSTKAYSNTGSKRGYSTLQPNNPTVLCPITTEVTPQNILLLNNLSSATTNTSKTTTKPEFQNQFHTSESNFGRKKSKDKKKSSCKKKPCAKFQLENCPKKERESCKTHHPVICQKAKAPYPAFTDCMDEQMEENIAECPLVKERILRLQPKHMNTMPKLPILPPIKPDQGRIDKTKEEDCIREKLCMKNEGVTQGCSDFGSFIKPMRSKDYIKEKNRDCQKIEDLKKSGKWPPKQTKGFCTSATNRFNMQKRELSTVPNIYSISSCILDTNRDDLTRSEMYKSDMFESNSLVASGNDWERTDSLKTRRVYVRNYNTFFNPENRITENSTKKSGTILQNHFEDSNELCRFVKLKNIQWRINNFQKWCKLNKLSNLPTPIKRFHTCSKIKYQRYTKRSHSSKNLSTNTTKCASTSENLDLYTQRGISTTMILGKADSEHDVGAGGGRRKPNKFSIVTKGRTARKCPKFKLPNCPPRARMTCERKRVDRPCTKALTPNPAFSECYDEEPVQPITECPLERERFQRLQPQYPLLPEIGTISLPPPHQGRIDYSLEDDYIRLKLGIKNEGLTQDCETFGQPVKVLKCKNYTNYEYMSRGKANQCLINRKERENAQRDPCKCPKQPCPNIRTKCDDSLWQRVVNYFKARPNCPSPDEWKKRALREKAEKAARAAGLCLCEPQDLPKKICTKDLPRVITPKNSCLNMRDEEDSCDEDATGSRKKNTCSPRNRCSKMSNPRRCFSTIPQKYYSSNVLTPKTSCPVIRDDDEKHFNASTKESSSASIFNPNTRCCKVSEPRCFSKSPRRCYSSTSYYEPTEKTLCSKTRHEEDRDSCHKGVTRTQQFQYRKASSHSPNNKYGKLSGFRGSFSTPPSRCYSSNVGWKNLDEINKTIEEEEKKKLAKKLSAPQTDEVNFLNDTNYNDEGLCHNLDTSYEDVFSEAVLNKHEENDITKFVEFDDTETPFNYAFQIVPNEQNLVEIIFNEPADELSNYSQARAFAAFQDYFNNIDAFSEVSYEDIEKAKTNNLLKELDKLLEDKEETKK